MTKSGFFSQSFSDKEKAIFSRLEVEIQSNDESKISNAINQLINCAGDFLEKMNAYSSTLSTFCQADKRFHAAISKMLNANNICNIEVHSMDGQKINLFDHLVSAKYFDEYNLKEVPLIHDSDEVSQKRRKFCLDRSCALGSYDALSARCNENAQAIVATKDEDEKHQLMEAIFSDFRKIINLYWGVGYLHVGALMIEYANELSKNKDTLDTAVTICEQAIKTKLCAYFLEDNVHSKDIEKSLTHGNGYFNDGLAPGCKNWDDYKIKLCSRAGTNANYERLYDLAKEEMSAFINRGEFKPDI